MNNLEVLYFGSYNPNYSRNRVLIKGLNKSNVKIIECNCRSFSIFGYFKILFKYLKTRPKYDAMLVAFPGQEAMFLARFLTRKPIIFDAFTSHYGGYILDRKKYSQSSLRAKYYKFLDKWSCKLADIVLLDTEAHIDFFVKEFNLPKEKFRRIFVGTDSDIFYPRNTRNIDMSKYPFLVHFHGNYIPLQGVRYIIEAAKILEREDLVFNLIGRGQTFENDRRYAERLKTANINFLEPVPYEKLPEHISRADLCLGIFGDSPKTDLVIPNKVYEALAMAKPVITADTLAARELLIDGVNAFLCPKADPQKLAEKILFVRSQPDIADKAAKNGRRLFETKLKEKILGAEVLEYINELTHSLRI